MSHYAYLTGVESRERAARYDFSEVSVHSGPGLEATYMIPLFWLACFGPGDALTVTIDTYYGEKAQLTVLCSPIADVISRLRRRQSSVLGLIGASFAPLYADWIAFLEQQYPHHLLLKTEDLFSMEGYEKASLRLQAAMRFLAVADSGARIKERAAIDWLASLEGTFDLRVRGEDAQSAANRWRVILSGAADPGDEAVRWPLPASPAEITFAASRPEAAMPPEPGTAAAEDYRLAQNIRQGVFADSGREGLRLAADKLAGRVPLGVNAPTKGMRKLIGGGNELLELLGSVALGVFLFSFGALAIWAGLDDTTINWMLVGIGTALCVLALLPVRRARNALRKLRVIARA